MITGADKALNNAIINGIRRDIDIALNNECYRAAVILIYSGIDTMAYLDMPEGQNNVTRSDFIDWAEKYIYFPCAEQLTGEDLYSARCGMLHTYSVESQRSRKGLARQIIYADVNIPEVAYAPDVDPNVVLVSIAALRDAFFGGIAGYLKDLLTDADRQRVAAERMVKLVQVIPYSEQDTETSSTDSISNSPAVGPL